jgi:hypothetical protein
MSFDIVIPLGPNEIERIHQQIEYTKKNVMGYRNIYIVSCDPTILIEGCIMIDENTFEFKLEDVATYFAQHDGKKNRNGWYFQQLLKLYAGFCIEGILDHYLVIDADVFFLKPIRFIQDNKPIFTTSNEYHIPYFEHMKRLHPTLEKKHEKSGISHHMMFHKKYVRELFDLVESSNNKENKKCWLLFLESVNEHRKYSIYHVDSGASEYELYFHYMVQFHSDKMIIRELNWENKAIHDYQMDGYDKNLDYISVCHWM